MKPIRLNIGCGRNILEGWINVDQAALSGVDIVADLDRCAQTPLPLADGSVDEFLLSHVIEHIRQPLPLMQELYRVARPGAIAVVRVPHGANDEAWADPTHVRPMFPTSFAYFSQLAYWRADYAYRGDWEMRKLTLFLSQAACQGRTQPEILDDIQTKRNLVQEMVVELEAIKPARLPAGLYSQSYQTHINLV